MPPLDPENAHWFAADVQPHEPLLRAWLRNRFGSQLDIDDLVQDALMRVIAAKLAGEVRAPKALLFATARNLALNQLRRRSIFSTAPLVESGGLLVLDDAADISEGVAKQHDLQLLSEAIQSLPERCRQIFTLRKLYGYSQQEIAAQLGLSPATVSAQLTIGLDKCTEHFARARRERKGPR